jgi:hypothetical protein
MRYEGLTPGKCCRARLCEKPDPLNALGSVAGYLRNSQFFRINDKMQRRLLVNMKQAVMELPRIPDGSGSRSLAPVHVFIIQAVNSGLLPVCQKYHKLNLTQLC